MGNKNNLLPKQSSSAHDDNKDYRLPSTVNSKSAPARPVLSRGSSLTDAEASTSASQQENGFNNIDRSSQPIEIPVLQSLPQDRGLSHTPEDFVTPATPLFAHESFGAYDFGVADERCDNLLTLVTSRQSIASSGAFAPEDTPVDVDDPTLERFPSERSSVVDTLRRISTSTGEQPVHLHHTPTSSQASRRASVDSTADSVSSSDALSPTTSMRKRDSRLSHSSLGRTKSTISLKSIVEETPGAPADPEPTGLDGPLRHDASQATSGEDDGPKIHHGKVTSGDHSKGSSLAQALGSHRGTKPKRAVPTHADPLPKPRGDFAGDLYLRSTENRW